MVKNLFYFNRLGFGGTEQFLYEVVKKYSKDFHIAVAYSEGAIKQVERLSKYVDVIKWRKGMKIECEKAFLSFNIEILDDLICDDITFVNHANVEIVGMPPNHPRIKRTINVSKFCQDIYLKHYNVPSEVSYNPITIEDYEKPLILLSAFRGNDPVRGARRCRELANRLDLYCLNNDKRYLWFMFTQKPSVPIESPNVIILEPRTDVRAYMQLADWGVNLPDDMETYGYTNVEFLLYGVPLVTTPITVCDELNIDSSMRLILNYDLSNVDDVIENMFNKKMDFKYTPPKDRWNEILAKGKGEVKENLKMKLFKVKANNVSSDRGIVLGELGRPAKVGEEFITTEDRVENLCNGKNKFNVVFATLLEEVKDEPKEVKEENKGEPIVEEKPVKKTKKTSKKEKK